MKVLEWNYLILSDHLPLVSTSLRLPKCKKWWYLSVWTHPPSLVCTRKSKSICLPLWNKFTVRNYLNATALCYHLILHIYACSIYTYSEVSRKQMSTKMCVYRMLIFFQIHKVVSISNPSLCIKYMVIHFCTGCPGSQRRVLGCYIFSTINQLYGAESLWS